MPAADRLDEVLRAAAGRPRLTWYGAGGERVELSGAVAAMWVVKTANLLLDEADAGPGSRVRLDLPGHWRTVVWALACWRVGAQVLLAPGLPDTPHADDSPHPPDAADVLVTDRPGPAGRSLQVVVTLAALARRYPEDLPAGAIDDAASVNGEPDRLGPVRPPQPGDPALDGRGYADLLAPGGTDRLLVVCPDRADADWLRGCAGTLAGGGSLVLLGPGHPAVTDAEARARLAATERAAGSTA